MTDVAKRSHLAFLIRLTLYFVLLGAMLLTIFRYLPPVLEASPVAPGSEITQTFIKGLFASAKRPPVMAGGSIGTSLAVLAVLASFFVGTLALMLPITWTYMYTHPDTYRRSLITALLILPICATATVWLIQDSLPLAFGLAALVAAVRFRIRLDNPLDGVYIFAAISVGLSCGVGHLGVGYVMSAFFCLCASVAWVLDYGRRPHPETPAADSAELPPAKPDRDDQRQPR